MQRIFSNAELMSLDHSIEYIGDFNFRNVQSINIQGVILDKTYSGIVPIWSGVSGMTYESNDYDNFTINGIPLGVGILRNLEFEAGSDVNQKRYTASIDIYSPGNLYNLSGAYYSGLSVLQSKRIDLIESLSEDFNFSAQEDGTYSYQRDLSLKIISGLGTNPQNIAKDIAKTFFSGAISPLINSKYPNFYLASGKKVYSESYNLTNGDYTFSEKFDFQNENPYIWTYGHSMEYNENTSNVTENGIFMGVGVDAYNQARLGYLNNISGAYNRCSGIYVIYMGSGCSGLFRSPSNQTITNNPFLGSLEYSISYSDDLTFQSGVLWENTINYSKERDGYYNFSEQGSILGQGRRTYNPNSKYIQALSYFQVVSGSVFQRINSVAQSELSSTPCVSSIKLASRSFSDSEYEGSIDYEYSYTNNPNYNTPVGINYNKVTLSKNEPVALHSIFGVINEREYVAPVEDGNSSLGSWSSEVEVVVDNGPQALSNALNRAADLVETPNSERFISDLEYTYDPKMGKLNLNATYSYNQYRSFANILV